MNHRQTGLLLIVLAALGAGSGALLTGCEDGAKSRASAPQLDEDRPGRTAGNGTGTATGAAINCRTLAHWTGTGSGPRINQRHVFCGEWDKRRSTPKGFHSRPGGRNPGTVAKLEISQRPDSAGIYGIRWRFSGEHGDDKFSTMFPDHCTREQVLASIGYAAQHRQRCPSGAPHWAWCGPSAATGDRAKGYCTGKDSTRFTIAGGTLDDGRINTAFPLR
ncbi:MAG: EndoU domain-containing protein [Gammaproteobacteria bacterium]